MIEVVRVRTRATLLEINELIRRAVRATRYPGTNELLVFAELMRSIDADSLGLFAAPAGEPRAVVLALLPTSALMMGPQVVLAYNEGPPKLKLAETLGNRLAAWLRANGHDHFYALNLWRDDRVFCRGLRYGGNGRRIAGMIRFDLPET